MSNVMNVKTIKIRISLEELKNNPSKLESYSPNLFIKHTESDGMMKEYYVLDIVCYFVNVLSNEISLVLLVQDIELTDLNDNRLVETTNVNNRHERTNFKIYKSLDNIINEADINGFNPNSFFYNKENYLIRMKEVHQLSYDAEKNALCILGYAEPQLGVINNEIIAKKKGVQRPKMKIIIQ